MIGLTCLIGSKYRKGSKVQKVCKYKKGRKGKFAYVAIKRLTGRYGE